MGEPITVGVPLPRGVVKDAARIGARRRRPGRCPVQALPTELWPDGSIRWALLDFQATGDLRAGAPLPPDAGRRRRRAARAARDDHRSRPTRSWWTLAPRSSGCRPGVGFPFEHVTAGGLAPIDAASSAFVVIDAKGTSWRARITKVEVEDRGPVRSSVRLDALCRAAAAAAAAGHRARPFLRRVARRCGSRSRVRNPRRARHKGGFWDLGDRGSIHLRDASLHVALPSRRDGARVRAGAWA